MRIAFTICADITPLGKNDEMNYAMEVALDELVFKLSGIVRQENIKIEHYRWEEI